MFLKNMKPYCTFLGFLSLFFLLISNVDAREIPDISLDTHNRISNPDNILSSQVHDTAQNLLVSIEQEITHDCGGTEVGYQAAAMVIRQLSDWRVANEKWGSLAEKMTTFTQAVHNTWGVGNLPCNDGTVLAFSVVDRQMYISRGHGMNDLLPDKYLDIVFDRMRPYLQNEDYDRAIISGILDLKTLIKRDENSDEYKELMKHFNLHPAIIAIIVVFCTIPGVIALVFTIIRCRGVKSASERRAVRRRLEQMDELIKKNFPGGKIMSVSSPIAKGDVPSKEGQPPEVLGPPTPSAPTASAPAPSAPVLGAADDMVPESPPEKYVPLANQLNCCPICFDDYLPTTPKETQRCGHTFCRSCIKSWLKKNITCPLCRTVLKEKKTEAPVGAATPSVMTPNIYHSDTYGTVDDVDGLDYTTMDSRQRIRRNENEMSQLIFMLTRRYPRTTRYWGVRPNMLYTGRTLSQSIPANYSTVNSTISSRGGTRSSGTRTRVSTGRSFGGGFSGGGRGGSW